MLVHWYGVRRWVCFIAFFWFGALSRHLLFFLCMFSCGYAVVLCRGVA